MTCAHLNEHDEHIVTLRNFNHGGMYFESDEELLIGSFIVLRTVGADDMENLVSSPDEPFQFSIESSDPKACWGYRSHTVAKVLRCTKVDDGATRYGVGAEVLILSD